MEASPILAALGIGVALAAAPGPVQAVLLAESVRGGVGRGLRALAGVHVTFGLVLVSLAMGLSIAAPDGVALRLLRAAGGLLLLWLAVDAVRAKGSVGGEARTGRVTPPTVRGALAIVLNPAGWLFLAAVASPLLATAAHGGGSLAAVLAALALMLGTAAGDLVLVFLGGLGLRRAGERVVGYVQLTLAAVLAGLGVWLLLSAIRP